MYVNWGKFLKIKTFWKLFMKFFGVGNLNKHTGWRKHFTRWLIFGTCWFLVAWNRPHQKSITSNLKVYAKTVIQEVVKNSPRGILILFWKRPGFDTSKTAELTMFLRHIASLMEYWQKWKGTAQQSPFDKMYPRYTWCFFFFVHP